MRLLPREQKERIEKHFDWLLGEAKSSRVVILSEPCDCGSHIRHNNGGNYHEIIEFTFDDGSWYGKYGTTSEYSEPQWVKVKEEEIVKDLKKTLSDGWSWYIEGDE